MSEHAASPRQYNKIRIASCVVNRIEAEFMIEPFHWFQNSGHSSFAISHPCLLHEVLEDLSTASLRFEERTTSGTALPDFGGAIAASTPVKLIGESPRVLIADRRAQYSPCHYLAVE